jgi:TIR domain
MSDVFISWGSPDEKMVKYLCSRLQDMGVDFFDYNRDMDAGDAISSRVAAEIRKASIAVVCLSDMSTRREWILTEVALLHEARERGTLKAILPVQVGALTPEQIPALIRSSDSNILDLSQEGEVAAEKLLRAIRKNLGKKNPVALPIMLFAMTADQFDHISNNPELRAALLEVCQPLGMVDPEEGSDALIKFLRQRYGNQPEDFSPFKPERPLIETVRGAIRQLNFRRSPHDGPPVFDRWINGDFFGEDQERRDEVRRLWLRNQSLLIIDSLSVWHPVISAQLKEISYQLDRMAVVWIPPYTQRIGELEAKIAQGIGAVTQIGDFFREWQERGQTYDLSILDLPILWGAFDVSIETSLWHWLYRLCGTLEPRLNGEALADMNRSHSVPIQMDDFYRRSARAGRP